MTVITATLSVVALIISGTLPTPERFIAPLSLSFAGLIFLWAFFILRIFIKWRREFVLHFCDLNKIRHDIYNIRDGRLSIFASKKIEIPPLMKLDSVFMNASYAVIATTATVVTAFMWLVRAQSLTFLVGIYAGLFLLEDLLMHGYLIFKKEQGSEVEERRLIRQFNDDINKDKGARSKILVVTLMLEILWLCAIITACILSLLSVTIFIFFLLGFAGKALLFGQAMWMYKKEIRSVLLN